MTDDPKSILKALRGILQDRAKLIDFVDHFIDDAIERGIADEVPEVVEIMRYMAKKNAESNIELAFRHAGSEIEKLFLNALTIASIMKEPAFLTFTPPSKSIEEDLQNLRGNMRELRKMFDLYASKVEQTDYKEFAKLVVESGAAPGRTEMEILSQTMMDFGLNHANHFHCTLQPRFKTVQVDGKPIRTDLLIWIPFKEEFLLVVECDGFKYHSSEEKFVNDRKRDRALKLKGFEVMRYSGKEIYNDCAGVAIELVSYLSDRGDKMNLDASSEL